MHPDERLTFQPAHGRGYRVVRQGDGRLVVIGVVVPTRMPSRVRIGRAQVDPWWTPITPDGSEGPAFMRRRDAAAWLLENLPIDASAPPWHSAT